MKYCIKCTTFKDESEFKWRNRAKGWLKPYCIPCNKAYDKEHHPNRSPESVRKKYQVRKNIVTQNVDKLCNYFLTHPCVDCGETDVRTLDFDHLLDKTFNVADLISRHATWERITEEMVKCEVRCANCHRKITHERANTRKQQWFDKYQKEVLQSVNGMDTSEKQT